MKKPARPDSARGTTPENSQEEEQDVVIVPTEKLDEFIEKEARKRNKTETPKEYRKHLARSIALAGKWITDHAAEIAGDIEKRRRLEIWLTWESGEISPEIRIENEYISVEAAEAMFK